MRRGYLSQYFDGIAIKRLSAVEADETRSNQHEYNATRPMLEFMGRPTDATRLDTRFIYLDDDAEPVVTDAFLTLYDSRANHPTRTEYRFYFPTTPVSERASEGDLLVVAKAQAGNMLVVVASGGSSAAQQMAWLFDHDSELPGFSVRSNFDTERDQIGFAAYFILENIGVEIEVSDDIFLEEMLNRFGGRFPKTSEFSRFARNTLPEISAADDPDSALMAWMEREERLFRVLERHLIAGRLEQGFLPDRVEEFIGFSLSVQNRRKSRVGLALENHVESVFVALGIRFSRTAVTENRAKPDFLLPGKAEYDDATFDSLRLTMLGVKSTCKERWRQVLAEADRIPRKHLLTLEPSISTGQTDEMRAKGLQLIVPGGLQSTFSEAQKAWLLDVRSFTRLVLNRQAA